MSEDSKPVQFFIGGQPTSVVRGEIAHQDGNTYKDYIIQQNIVLQQENKRLSQETRDLQGQLSELEDENSDHDSKARRLKQYVGNFHSLSEIYKEIAEKDYQYFTEFTKNNITIWYNSSHLFMIVAIIAVLSQLFIPAPIGFIATITLYYYFIHPKVFDNVSIHKKAIIELISFRKQKESDLKGLTKTMDIIGEFIDNAL